MITRTRNTALGAGVAVAGVALARWRASHATHEVELHDFDHHRREAEDWLYVGTELAVANPVRRLAHVGPRGQAKADQALAIAAVHASLAGAVAADRLASMVDHELVPEPDFTHLYDGDRGVQP